MIKPRLHIAHIGLLDAAPLLVAQEQGYFAAESLDVVLSCELGLASVCGKLAERRIDGACVPAPLAVLLSLGAGLPRVPVQVVQVCARQGMGLVLTTSRAPGAGNAGPRVGVIAPGTPTRIFLQRLQQQSPAALPADVVTVPMAASQLLDFLREGMLDGFCGIDPLPALACLHGAAKIVADSASLLPMHPAGVVALQVELLEGNPKLAGAMGRALQRAREYCAAPANREDLWRLLLAQHPYVALDEAGRAALASGDGTSMRFDGRGHLAAGEDVAFLEAACRGAIGPSARVLDLRAEIARVFAPCAAAGGAAAPAAAAAAANGVTKP